MSTTALDRNYRLVALDALVESETNPRRHFEGLEELTASIKEHGVLTPLLVRSTGKIDLYEIIAGARRYRAASAANAEQVPVVVREMSDEQAIELQIVENLQRRDVHPLDEALGYQRLIDLGQTVEQIADKVSKSASYVYQRLKLAALVPEGQDMFFKEALTAGHAVQIARLNPKNQKDVLQWMGPHSPSVRDLAELIAQKFHLQLKTADFPTDDPELVPVAGSCKECPKRSGANPLLFPDVKAKDTCSDPICFHAKEVAFVKLQIEKTPEAIPLVVRPSYAERVNGEVAWTRTNGRKCESTGVGIVTSITDPWQAEREKLKLGQELQVCIDPKCKIHHPAAAQRSDYNPRSGASRKAEKSAKLEVKRQQAILQATLLRPAIFPMPAEFKQQLEWALENLSADAARLLCGAMGWEVKPDRYKQRNWHGAVTAKLRDTKEASATLYILAVVQEMWRYGGSGTEPKDSKHLEAAATRRGVNVKAISKQVKESAEKKPSVKRSGKVGTTGEKKPKPAAKKQAKAKKAPKKKAA